MTNIGIFIKESRIKLGLSRKAFVERMPEPTRITISTLGQIERGRIKRPPDIRLKGFARVLNTSVSVLKKMLSVASFTVLLNPLFQKEVKSMNLMKEYYPEEGYHLAFSGGKDSIVVKNLLDMSGLKYEGYFAVTTVDPPDLIKFIRKNHPNINFLKPKISMYKMIAYTKHSLPTRIGRFCCSELKEWAGKGEFVVTGIRWEESHKRKSRKAFEISTNKNDKGKMFLHPIIEWTSMEVWSYINHYKLPYPSMYDEGFERIGCVGCPLAPAHIRRLEFERYPKYKKMYLRAIKKAMTARKDNGEPYAIKKYFKDEYEAFDWWMSNLSIKMYFEKKKQLKLWNQHPTKYFS